MRNSATRVGYLSVYKGIKEAHSREAHFQDIGQSAGG
jgi:hypothetical protein